MPSRRSESSRRRFLRSSTARKGKPANVTFEVKDVTRLGDESRFDLVTAFDAIHDQADPAGVLRRVHDALEPGGVLAMFDTKAATAPRSSPNASVRRGSTTSMTALWQPGPTEP